MASEIVVDSRPWCPYRHPVSDQLCGIIQNHEHVDNGCGPEVVMRPGEPPEFFPRRSFAALIDSRSTW